MLHVLGNPRRFCDGVSRRQAMTAGALSVLGGALDLPSPLAMEQRRLAGGLAGKAKHVLLLYLHGGAPTQDMFDMKPAAPVEIRGEFQPIATNVPGIQICEHLPRMAQWMHRSAIVRSVNHRAGCHNTLPSFTGSEQPVDINDPVPKNSFPPSMGSVCEYLRAPDDDMPHYAALPTHLGWGYAIKRPGPWGGFLGKRYDPLCGGSQPAIDPNPPQGRRPMWLGTPFLADTNFASDLSIDRINSRRTLLQQIDNQHRQADDRGATSGFDRMRQRAFSLLTASKFKAAFNLEAEDPRLCERYGKHLFGQSVLIARRLIEAGVRLVDVYWDGYTSRVSITDPDLDPYWDTHDKNFVRLKQVNLPYLDQTFDALMTDLEHRGLIDETLVVLMSDFGRTPRVNAQAGRDHWTFCYSVLLAGAGIRGGTVCGASDAQAAYVSDRPVRPADICATIYHCLGIDPEMQVKDRSGRPVPISHGGRPIDEILA